MVELFQKGRWIYVKDSTLLIDNILDNSLSYTKKGAEFMARPEWGIVHLYNKKINKFPIGLLNRVKLILKNKGVECSFNQKSLKETPLLNYDTLRPYQIEALDSMFIHRNGILKLPTGAGKTFLAIQYIKHKKSPTLVLVPTLDLVTQWSKQVPDYVVVKTYMGVRSKEFLQKFDIIIFDECHHAQCKTLLKIGLNVNENARVFGLSATPFNGEEPLKVEAVLGPIIYEVPLRQLIDEGFLCDAVVHYHEVPQEAYGFDNYQEVYRQYIVENLVRNSKIVDLAKVSKKPCLVLVSQIDHGTVLTDMLKVHGLDVVFLNGQCKKDERADTDHDIIVATSVFDEGVDLPALRTLILASGGKSAIKATQRIGRILRPLEGKEMAVVHDFKDSCKYLFKHYKQRRNIFERDFEVTDE